MASEERPPGDPVDPSLQSVAEIAPRNGFTASVALLERLTPNAPRIGGLGPAAEEAVFFRHDPSMVFHSADIISIKRVPKQNPAGFGESRMIYEVVCTFLGLTGAASPLPSYFSEEVAHEDPDYPAQREFLDLFHHRLLSLFYRWRCKFNFAREYLSDQSDLWSKRALSLAGVDTFEAKAPFQHLSVWQLLRLSPLLAHRSRTSKVLSTALMDVMKEALQGAKISVQQFVGRWVEIEVPQRFRLGIQNTHLARNAVLGMKIYDRGGKFRLVIGPLSNRNFRRFLPDGDQIPIIREACGVFLRDQLDYDLELVLSSDATPAFALTKDPTAKLGIDTWLTTGRKEEKRVIVEVPFHDPNAPTETETTSSTDYAQ